MISKLLDRLAVRLGTPEEINGHNRCPTYLYRWELISARVLGREFKAYLHKFVGDDWSRDLHDHPKRFWSIGIAGRYTEIAEGAAPREYHAPWIRTFAAEHRHRLIGPTPAAPCWTIVIVGHPIRVWGFWTRHGFVDWRRYVAPGSVAADLARACV